MEGDVGDPVILPIGDAIDLHPFAPKEVVAVATEYLVAARDAGRLEVRLIHGRGRGVQRAGILAALARLPWVLEVREGSADAGGWGATVVRLAPADPKDIS